jgi:SAM-dependent MidA family methyltransferase
MTKESPRAMPAPLPEPSADARAASAAVCELIAAEIIAAGGWIPFSRYMELALYAPGLGYYSGGSQKFGAAGDFVTAPELTPLFAQALAVQVAQVLAGSAPHILEVGAGRGTLAGQLLLELERGNCLPERYLILELSGELRARQRQTLIQVAPHLVPRVAWLDALPPSFAGLVLGNEVLDAMPVALVEWRDAETILERGVVLDERGSFAFASRPAQGELLLAAQALAGQVPIAGPYVSEIGLVASAWLREWGRVLERGAVLLLDYGFPRAEYYFPQRGSGTLMCHYRHHAHDDPLWWPGLNDISAHVDFTAVAEAGFEAGLEVLGYTSQAQFLLNCGITEILGRLPNDGGKVFLTQSRNVGKLIAPHEMGELFKVIALGRGLKEPLLGFARGDRLHTL